MNSKKIRLNLFIAKYSSHSRRQADKLIKNKHISINGQISTQMGLLVHPKNDCIQIKGKILRPFYKPLYIALNKPKKVLTTSKDPKNRITIYHYLKKIKHRVFPVGRLDYLAEGLLLLTNDGLWAQKIMNPKNKIHKTYLVQLDDIPHLNQLEKLKKGVSIPGGRVRAVNIQKKTRSWVRITIQEGKNKQLHYMFNKIGFNIKKLKRTSIGKLKLRSIKQGQAVHLTNREKAKVFQNSSFKK